jgi:predicted ATPase
VFNTSHASHNGRQQQGDGHMNIIDSLITRIEDYRATNKNPCKNYATGEAADKATSAMAKKAANHFAVDFRNGQSEARYVVFYNEAWGRWVGAIDMSELCSRKTSTGGYLGICTGFFTY